ncbi:hypothetical protein [Joostella sp. CR20]|uniref:hypothetical protein n=1 Tax=Joostella sp. CR20 TaxID=2804312 RepID=UPI00313BF5D3
MKSTLILIISLLMLFIFIGKPEIKFNPFSFKLHGWVQMLGWVFLILAMVLISYKSNKEQYIKGFKDGAEHLANEIKKDLTSKEKENGKNN